MRYRLPEGTTALSHGGEVVPAAADGTIEIDAGMVAFLAPHGVEPVADPVPLDPTRAAPRRAAAKPTR